MEKSQIVDRKPTGFLFTTITAMYVMAYAFAGIFMMKILGSPVPGVPFAIAGDIVFFIILYIGSDIFSQVYGYKVSRQTAKLAAGVTLSLGIVGKLLTFIPVVPGNEWADGIFSAIYGGNFYITIVGVAVFFVGDWINDKIFQKFREKHNNDMSLAKFTFRSIFSSFVGRTFDVILFTIFCNLIINAPDLGLPKIFVDIHNFLGLESWQQSWGVIIASMVCTAIVQPLLELVFAPLSRHVCHKLMSASDE